MAQGESPPSRNGRIPDVITFEGVIGAGKTELAKVFAARLRERGLRVTLILEPVEQWREVGILGKFYKDPGRYGYGFQTFVFATRVLEIAAAVSRDPHVDVFVLERSPATDLVFMALQHGVVDQVETDMYQTWCMAYQLMLPLDLRRARVLYLRTSLAQCMARLENRRREGEMALPLEGAPARDGSAAGGVSLEYQMRLHRAHEEFFHVAPPSGEFPMLPASPYAKSAVTCIDPEYADGNFRDAGPEQDRIVDHILKLTGF